MSGVRRRSQSSDRRLPSCGPSSSVPALLSRRSPVWCADARRSRRHLRPLTDPDPGFRGAAVDFSRASSVKADMQAALDSTALMISKRAAPLQHGTGDIGTKQFLAMFNRPDAKNVTVTARYSTSGGSSVALSAAADIDTDFISILGYRRSRSAPRPSPNGARRVCAWRWCSIPPARWPTTARLPRSRPPPKPADAIARCGEQRGRRLCLDHPVQQKCERRCRQLWRELDRLERLGSGTGQPEDFEAE